MYIVYVLRILRSKVARRYGQLNPLCAVLHRGFFSEEARMGDNYGGNLEKTVCYARR